MLGCVTWCANGWAQEQGSEIQGTESVNSTAPDIVARELLSPEATGESPPANASSSEQASPAISPAISPASELSAKPPSVPFRMSADANLVAPDIFLLPDGEGNLRKVLGFRYEDFLQSWQQFKADSPGSPRPFVIESLRATGEATGSHATVRMEFEVLALADGWQEAPLKIPSAILQDVSIQDRVNGESVFFDNERQSYVFWYKGTANESRRLVLDVLVPLSRDLKRTWLELHLPQATVSEFSLEVSPSQAKFEISSGVVLNTKPATPSGTIARIAGAVGPLRLEWTAPAPRPDASNIVQLESTGDLRVEVERERVLYDAQLLIESRGGPLDRLRIRLPANSQLAEGPSSQQFRIVEVAPEAGSDTSDRVVEIESLLPQSTNWDLRLKAEQEIADGDETSFTLSGFEVVGAFRQSGAMTLLIDDQLQVYFDPEGNILQVPLQRSGEQTSERSPVAQFTYSSKPWSLEVHSIARQRRVNVRPQYEVSLERDEARLHFECEYQFSGATTFAVRIDLRGWELTDDPIESGGTIDQDRYVVTRDGLLIMPLVNPEVGRVRLSFSARKNIQLGNVELPLPEPLGAFVLPGKVQVLSNPALLVSPQFAAMEGIQSGKTSGIGTEAPRVSGSLPSDGAEPSDSHLELVTYLSRPLLVMRVSRRERVVYVDVETRVQLGAETARVTQLLEYQVNYQPLSQLLLKVPAVVRESGTLTARMGELEVQLAADSSNARNSSATNDRAPRGTPGTGRMPILQGMNAYLPRPMLNTFRLELSYELPLDALTAQPDSSDSVAFDDDTSDEVTNEVAANGKAPMIVPLVMPADTVDANQLLVASDQSSRIALDPSPSGDRWEVSKSRSDDATSDVVGLFEAKGDAHEIAFIVQPMQTQQTDMVLLEKSWLQTWIVDRRRQDRAVFQFRPLGRNVVVDLPRRLEPHEIEVLIDGRASAFEILESRRLIVPIVPDETPGSRTIELRYQRSEPLQNGAEVLAEFPRPVANEAMLQAFWHVVLPEGWLVLRSPAMMSGEYFVGWRDARWGRHPTISQQELEVWSRASRQLAPSPAATQYVFGSLDSPGEVTVKVVRESWVVVTAAIAAFLLGLLVTYTTIARQGAFWATIGLGLVTLVIIAPEYALLAGQAILLGGSMLLATLFLRRAFEVAEDSKPLTSRGNWSGSTVTTEPWPDNSGERTELREATTASLQTTGSQP